MNIEGVSRMIRCVLGDRSAFFTEGLTSVLRRGGEAAIVGSTAEPRDLPGLVARLNPDVAIVSFEPPAAALAATRALQPGTGGSPGIDVPVLLLTWSRREDDLLDALRAGATGFVHKEVDPEDLTRAVVEVASGRTAFPLGWERLLVSRLDGHRPTGQRRGDPVTLTSRERDIVQLIVDGHSNKAQASRLGIAHQTAKNHVRHVMAKLRVTSRVQLCAWALERGYAPSATAATV
ncbi:MAG: LuxR C-terminal-related transcriptional regulator [Acidimicrobiia bacterium]